MQLKSESQNTVAKEIKIIPAWLWALAGIGFVGSQVAFDIVMLRQTGHLRAWTVPLLGLLMGLLVGCYLLLLGYVNRDAKRRGMSPTLWTIMAVCIPNALGFILYFLLRQPLRCTCPQCRNLVESGFCFCPRCSYKLGPSCPQCQRVVTVDDAYCPFCGTPQRNQPARVPDTPTKPTDS
jgi:RNA polymerase subunit RPABC4/transcription elongation factor Spt4